MAHRTSIFFFVGKRVGLMISSDSEFKFYFLTMNLLFIYYYSLEMLAYRTTNECAFLFIENT